MSSSRRARRRVPGLRAPDSASRFVPRRRRLALERLEQRALLDVGAMVSGSVLEDADADYSASGVYATTTRTSDVSLNGDGDGFATTLLDAGPRIVSTSPPLGGATLPPLSSIDVTFSEPIDAATFTPNDVGLLGLANPADVTALYGHPTLGNAYDVQVVGNRAYVADDGGGLQILDVTNPAAVFRRGGYDTPGYAKGLHVVGNLAYVADSEAGLHILDVTKPAAVVRLGGYDTPGWAKGVQVVGNLAYVADYSAGLQVLDVTDPANVTRLGAYNTPGIAWRVQVVGNFAYVTDGDAGLQILDVTDPANVMLVGAYDTPGYAYGIQVVGNFAYVGDSDAGLQILDVTNPAAVVCRGGYDTPVSTKGVQVVGNLAYVADYSAGLQILDVTDPASVRLLGGYNTAGHAYGVQVIGNLAFVADGDRMTTIQLATPVVGLSQVSQSTYRIDFGRTLGGDYQLQIGPEILDPAGAVMDQDNDGLSREPSEDVYTARFAVQSPPMDISLSATAIREDWPAGTVVGTFFTTDANAGDTFTYSFANGTGAQDNSSFTIVDNQLRTNAVFDCETENSYSIRVRTTTEQDGLWYEKALTIAVANASWIVSASPRLDGSTLAPLSSIDITFNEPIDAATFGPSDVGLLGPGNPAGVTRVGGFDTSDSAVDVHVTGNRVYLARSTTGLQILDATNPADVTRLGGFDTAYAYGVQVVGSVAYVADGYAGLQILDVTNPASVTRVGGYDTSGSALDVEVAGNRVYLADGIGGLQVLDVSNPASVTRLGGYDTLGSAWRVQVVGNRAYVADRGAGLQILDVANPASVMRLGGYDTSGGCSSTLMYAKLDK